MLHYTKWLPSNRYLSKYKKKVYVEKIFTFDIETTSFFYTNNEWVSAKGHSQEELEDSTNLLAIPYIWQFAEDGNVYYGRTLRTFYDFCKLLNKNYPERKIIWVHNLSYEFSFLTQDFEFTTVFARQKGKIIYAFCKELNIEFRCSYMLTIMSLEKMSESFTFITQPKCVGGLDYDVARLPCTPLSHKEMEYCEIDVKIVYEYIKGIVNEYKCIADIPYTQTGIIRRHIKRNVLNSSSHKRLMNEIKPTYYDYRMLTRVMRGGITQCQWTFIDNSVKDVYHIDIASSYPFVMCTKYFPMSKWEWGDKDFFNPAYLYIYHVKLYNVSAKTPWAYISVSKSEEVKYHSGCDYTDSTVDGKILEAEYVDLWLTNVDLDIIKKVYDIDYISYIYYARSKKGMLPIPLIKYMLSLYKEKTEIKGIEHLVDLYTYKKQCLNGIYGMCQTNIFKDEQISEGYNYWTINYMNKEKLTKKLDKDKPFLSFSWGTFVTAYARESLFEMIMKFPLDCIYCDTDSAFFVDIKANKKYIDEINAMRYSEIERISKRLNIDFNYFNPVDKDGKNHPLGEWEFEKHLKRFKSVGSKKYVMETDDGKFIATVAGCRKKYYDFDIKKEVNVIKSFDEFYLSNEMKDGKVIGGKFKNGRSVAWHTHNQPAVILKDYLGNEYRNDQLCGTVILNTYYTLGITKAMNDFCSMAHNFYTNPFRTIL